VKKTRQKNRLRAFSSEVVAGSREETRQKNELRAFSTGRGAPSSGLVLSNYVRNLTYPFGVVQSFFGGFCMPSSKYHRDQAKLLAGLALSTNSQTQAQRFTLAAMEHLEQAEALDGPSRVQTQTPSSEKSPNHS